MTDEQQAAIDRARAFGLLLGACEAMTLRLLDPDRERIDKVITEARALWEKHEAK